MVVTMNDVLNALNPDEPNYNIASKLGPEALPHIEKIIETADPLLASKATYLASLIDDERSISILNNASKSKYPEVRISSAHGIKNLMSTEKNKNKTQSDLINRVLTDLNNDNDFGVKKAANKTISLLKK